MGFTSLSAKLKNIEEAKIQKIELGVLETSKKDVQINVYAMSVCDGLEIVVDGVVKAKVFVNKDGSVEMSEEK